MKLKPGRAGDQTGSQTGGQVSEETSGVNINISLPDNLHTRLKLAAALHGSSLKQYVSEALSIAASEAPDYFVGAANVQQTQQVQQGQQRQGRK